MTTPDLPDDVIRYLQIRDGGRADVVARTLAAMTERERALVREAAVMGWVRGARFGGVYGPNAEDPPDSQIVAGVVDACLAMPDLYPTVAYAANGPREER